MTVRPGEAIERPVTAALSFLRGLNPCGFPGNMRPLNTFAAHLRIIKLFVLNKRTNLANIDLEKIYIMIVSNKKLNIAWFKKKKGINCGMIYLYCFILLSSVYWIKKSSK